MKEITKKQSKIDVHPKRQMLVAVHIFMSTKQNSTKKLFLISIICQFNVRSVKKDEHFAVFVFLSFKAVAKKYFKN